MPPSVHCAARPAPIAGGERAAVMYALIQTVGLNGNLQA
jgi:hypothetical protein